jgi:hypothetical protein
MWTQSFERRPISHSLLLQGHLPMLTAWALGWALLSLPGCGGGSDVKRTSVSGTVQLDGTPLPAGTIQFIPNPGVKGPPVQLEIHDGKFSASTANGPTAGQNAVQITAMKKTGKKTKTIMGEEADEIIQYIPAQYNEQSTLTADIQSGGEPLTFQLESK